MLCPLRCPDALVQPWSLTWTDMGTWEPPSQPTPPRHSCPEAELRIPHASCPSHPETHRPSPKLHSPGRAQPGEQHMASQPGPMALPGDRAGATWVIRRKEAEVILKNKSKSVRGWRVWALQESSNRCRVKQGCGSSRLDGKPRSQAGEAAGMASSSSPL